jgi:hypothetical protein
VLRERGEQEEDRVQREKVKLVSLFSAVHTKVEPLHQQSREKNKEIEGRAWGRVGLRMI